jgi:translation initiation factor 2 alpha subunit (eIF-2alpha)
MAQSFTIATPRYRVVGVKGEYFDIFNKRANAIKKAIEMAVEYSGTTFLVEKVVLGKSEIIFRYKVDVQFAFDDLQTVCENIIKVYQKKLGKTKFWRKSDGDDR